MRRFTASAALAFLLCSGEAPWSSPLENRSRAKANQAGLVGFHRHCDHPSGFGAELRIGHFRYVPPYPYGYDPYSVYAFPYAYPPPYYGYWSGAPLHVPAEELYGPEPVKRLMGIPPAFRPDVHLNAVPENNIDAPAEPVVPRASNARSVALGRRFIEFGDAQFLDQKYTTAYLRYKEAVKAAPLLADAWFRQGFALVASGRYEWAARALKRGLELDPKWPRAGFRIDLLYGDNRMARQAHLDALAQAALDDPEDPDLLFLMGVMLHCDGEAQRASPFFQRAMELAGAEIAHLKAFLP